MSASRKEFEAWASSPEFGLTQAHFTLDEDGEYVNYPAHCYWLVWQGCHKHMQEQVDSANANMENAVAHMQSFCAERDRLNALLIESEAVRIGQGLQRHDDQKQMDEMVALGIQQDKDEISSLKEENGDLKFALQLIMAEGGTAGAIAYQALKELEQ